MINAKEEFLRHFREVGTWRGVKCASVEYKDLTFGLKQNFEVGDFSTFLKELDFEYDNSWGIQELTVLSGLRMVLGLNDQNTMVLNGGNIGPVQKSRKV